MSDLVWNCDLHKTGVRVPVRTLAWPTTDYAIIIELDADGIPKIGQRPVRIFIWDLVLGWPEAPQSDQERILAAVMRRPL